MDYELSGKRVLVTGATGFIGRHVVPRLRAEGAVVRCLVRDAARAQHLAGPGVQVTQGDITDGPCVTRAVHGCQVVLHLAGMLVEFEPISRYREVNVEASRNLALAALDAGVERFVHASSVWVYGLRAGPGVDETWPLRPSGHAYADTKLEAQKAIADLAREAGLPAVIVQPSEVYGPGDVTWTLRPFRMIRDGRMVLLGKGLMHPIFISDLVDGIIAAMRRGRPGEAYILCGPESVSVPDYFGRLAAIVGRKRLPRLPGWAGLTFAAVAEAAARLTGRPPLLTRDEAKSVTCAAAYRGDKAARELRFRAGTGLDGGMATVEAWLRENGEIESAARAAGSRQWPRPAQ